MSYNDSNLPKNTSKMCYSTLFPDACQTKLFYVSVSTWKTNSSLSSYIVLPPDCMDLVLITYYIDGKLICYWRWIFIFIFIFFGTRVRGRRSQARGRKGNLRKKKKNGGDKRKVMTMRLLTKPPPPCGSSVTNPRNTATIEKIMLAIIMIAADLVTVATAVPVPCRWCWC